MGPIVGVMSFSDLVKLRGIDPATIPTIPFDDDVEIVRRRDPETK